MFISVTSSLAGAIPLLFADDMLVPFLVLRLYFRHSANKNIINLRYFIFVRCMRLLCNVKDYFSSHGVNWNNVL